MSWLPVTSSAFSHVRYDTTLKHLDVLYHNGSIYRYHRVPERVYRKLTVNSSPGNYLNGVVKPFFESIELPRVTDPLLQDAQQSER